MFNSTCLNVLCSTDKRSTLLLLFVYWQLSLKAMVTIYCLLLLLQSSFLYYLHTRQSIGVIYLIMLYSTTAEDL